MGVTEKTKLHHLCTMFRYRVMDISAGGHCVWMDLPYCFSDGCRAIVKVAMMRDGMILVSDDRRIAMHEPLTPEDVKMIRLSTVRCTKSPTRMASALQSGKLSMQSCLHMIARWNEVRR